MATDTKSTASREHTAPPQFTLRQSLLSIGALCAVLAIYRAMGPERATITVLFVALVIGFSVSFVQRQDGLAAVTGLMLIAVIAVVIAAPWGPRYVTTTRSACRNNLRQIAVALQCYHEAFGTLPPAYVADENGRPMHSWRVLILPFMEQQPLYNLYQFDEPWDGPNNRKLHQRGLPYNMCQANNSTSAELRQTETSYLLVVGPQTAFPGDKCVALNDITDDRGNTILVVEVKNSGIHWMEPRDLHVTQMARTINPATGQGISSNHALGANVTMADGSVRYLRAEELTTEDVESLLTINGNEPPPIPRD